MLPHVREFMHRSLSRIAKYGAIKRSCGRNGGATSPSTYDAICSACSSTPSTSPSRRTAAGVLAKVPSIRRYGMPVCACTRSARET
jgi:hypothetical protein